MEFQRGRLATDVNMGNYLCLCSFYGCFPQTFSYKFSKRNTYLLCRLSFTTRCRDQHMQFYSFPLHSRQRISTLAGIRQVNGKKQIHRFTIRTRIQIIVSEVFYWNVHFVQILHVATEISLIDFMTGKRDFGTTYNVECSEIVTWLLSFYLKRGHTSFKENTSSITKWLLMESNKRRYHLELIQN